MKGKFIVIDGTDGSGKGTQTNLLVKKLEFEGYDVEVADFPQYGQRSAALVEDYLNGKFGSAKEVGPYRASIFYACDRYAASFKIKKWLEQGKIVISNRYVSANMGHQAGKIKDIKERDKYLEWLENLEYGIFEIPKPDMTLLLFMPPEVGQKLVEKKGLRAYIKDGKKDIHEKDLEHLKDAAEAYKYVAKKYGWTIINCVDNKKIMTIEQVHKLVWEKIKNII
jgi:dTMP kinase